MTRPTSITRVQNDTLLIEDGYGDTVEIQFYCADKTAEERIYIAFDSDDGTERAVDISKEEFEKIKKEIKQLSFTNSKD